MKTVIVWHDIDMLYPKAILYYFDKGDMIDSTFNASMHINALTTLIIGPEFLLDDSQKIYKNWTNLVLKTEKYVILRVDGPRG